MVAIRKLPEKERRKERRRNHVARDLRTPKFKQQIVQSKTAYNRRKEFDENQEDE